jgi:hypothetical protein
MLLEFRYPDRMLSEEVVLFRVGAVDVSTDGQHHFFTTKDNAAAMRHVLRNHYEWQQMRATLTQDEIDQLMAMAALWEE